MEYCDICGHDERAHRSAGCNGYPAANSCGCVSLKFVGYSPRERMRKTALHVERARKNDVRRKNWHINNPGPAGETGEAKEDRYATALFQAMTWDERQRLIEALRGINSNIAAAERRR